MKAKLIVFLSVCLITCKTKKDFYKPEGSILVSELMPWDKWAVYKDMVLISEFRNDSFGVKSWFNDSLILGSSTKSSKDSKFTRILTVDVHGNIRDTLREFAYRGPIWDLYANYKSDKLLCVHSKTRNGNKSIAGYDGFIYDLNSGNDFKLINFCDSSKFIYFDELPWSLDASMITYYTSDGGFLRHNKLKVFLYDVQRMAVIKTFDGMRGGVWSPKTNEMALTDEAAVYIYNQNDGELKKIYDEKNKYLGIKSVHWLPDGKKLYLEMYTLNKNIFSLGGRCVEKILDVNTGRIIKSSYVGLFDPNIWSWR